MSEHTPICIAGMHRSGTSLTANLMRQCGLWLGADDEIYGATPDNPDGHWEHIRIVGTNDALLSELGGGWDHPPATGDGWLARENIARLRDDAEKILASLARPTPWGWKDPRASLLMPFWFSLRPDTRVVICIRNPLEVALSLRRRGLMSYSLGLKLWWIYNARLLADVPREQRIVTHFESLFAKPADEMRRLAAFCLLDVPAEKVASLASLAKPALRHARFGTRDLLAVDAAPEIVELYRALCDEAEFAESAETPRMDFSKIEVAGKQIDLEAMDRELVKRELTTLRQTFANRERCIAELTSSLQLTNDEAAAREAKLRELEAELARLRKTQG